MLKYRQEQEATEISKTNIKYKLTYNHCNITTEANSTLTQTRTDLTLKMIKETYIKHNTT